MSGSWPIRITKGTLGTTLYVPATQVSSVEIGLNPEKIRRKLILVSLDSKFFTEQHIQNPLKSPMGKIFYTQFSLKHMKSLKMSRIFVYTCVKKCASQF